MSIFFTFFPSRFFSFLFTYLDLIRLAQTLPLSTPVLVDFFRTAQALRNLLVLGVELLKVAT